MQQEAQIEDMMRRGMPLGAVAAALTSPETGDRIVAAKPVAQFAPFFRLVGNLDGDKSGQRYYLAPGILSAFDESNVERVGQMAKETAYNLDGHGLSQMVQTGGPDGPYIRRNNAA